MERPIYLASYCAAQPAIKFEPMRLHKWTSYSAATRSVRNEAIMKSISYALLIALLATLSGCGPEDPASSSIPKGQPAGTSCATINLTQPCRCADDAPGQQTCKAAGFTQCQCAIRAPGSAGSGAAAGPGAPNMAMGTQLAADPPANRSSVRFDWQRTMPAGGSCEAGHYEGTFTGFYSPAIIVVPDLPVIPVFPVELPGNPGLAFDLLREGNGEIFNVANGKMSGNALGAFPFTADVVGKLHCDTLQFDAKLVNGSYFIGPLEYRFEGPITADYDKQTHTMINGLWKVDEPDAPGSGGSGDWTVHWIHN
jgi:hypothetical protein